MNHLELIVRANLAGLKAARNSQVEEVSRCGASQSFGSCSAIKNDNYVAILVRDSSYDLMVVNACSKHLKDYLQYGWVEI